MSSMMYNKRPGTSGIHGQLYETKLLSLIHFIMKHDDDIEEFHLASNVKEAGAFDDIVFNVKLKGSDRPRFVFMQVKHKENTTQVLEIVMDKYFKSYLEIKSLFESKKQNMFSGENFEDCLFVIYTNAKVCSENNFFESSFTSKLNDLISTAKQPDTSQSSWAGLNADPNSIREFKNKLLIYSSQANETIVENILKDKIKKDICNVLDNIEIKADAIFMCYHDVIQKWWMEQPNKVSKRPGKVPYLTKKDTLYEQAINDIIGAPLLSVISMMYKIKHINYTFNEDALSLFSVKLQDQHSRTTIITESSALTVAKVIQCMENKDHTVLDLEYILNLPEDVRNALIAVLTNTDNEKILIFECDKVQSFGYVLENIEKAARNKKTIIIGNQMSVEIMNKYLAHSDNEILDTKINLNDMSEESQKSILKDTRVIFQGQEVSLELILDDESLACVEGEVLNTIISNKTIVIGKAMGNSTYDEIKHLYMDRCVKKTEDGGGDLKHVSSFYDIEDDVVFLTATPGMGKSTLLTHLSLNLKELDPKVWILRINLLEYSRELSMWKKDETDIDLLETLSFMCQVVLREKLGKENKIKFELEEGNGDVLLTYCTGDQETVFELKLFLHFYNREKLIILFDGFDEICPSYKNEVINCLKTIRNWPRKQRMWVTSRPYNEAKSILQLEFGTSYEIAPFSQEDKKNYLIKFWKSNLVLKEFNRKQRKNVHDFIKFMLDMNNFFNVVKYTFSLIPETYFFACSYIMDEIENTDLDLRTFYTDSNYEEAKRNFSRNYEFCMRTRYENSFENNPFLLYLTADYFQNNIKKRNKWDLDGNMFDFYARYIENKLKIRFKEKNKMDLYNPDIMATYDKELADVIAKHKILAAYALFHEHSDLIFNTIELKDIKDTIKLFGEVKEKTGLIHSVANGIPIFIHMTITEYLAVEYVCDSLKSEISTEKRYSWMDFILNIMFNFTHAVLLFDYKMQIDEALMSVLGNNKEVTFEVLIKQGQAHSEYCYNKMDDRRGKYWLFKEAGYLTDQLHNLSPLFIDALDSCLNEDNLNVFLEIVCVTETLRFNDDTRKNKTLYVLNIVRNIDKSKLNSVVIDNYCYLPRDTNYEAMTSEEILELILKQFNIEYEKALDMSNRRERARLFLTRPYVELEEHRATSQSTQSEHSEQCTAGHGAHPSSSTTPGPLLSASSPPSHVLQVVGPTSGGAPYAAFADSLSPLKDSSAPAVIGPSTDMGTPLPLQLTDPTSYVGHSGSPPDNLVTDFILQGNSKHSSLHSSLSDFEFVD